MLTERELAVLKLRKEGKTQAEIAKILKITQPAVSNFERNAQRKIADANTLLETLKKLGLLALGMLFVPLLAHNTTALPAVYHPASSIAAGTFDDGDFSFQNQLTVNGSLFIVNDTTGEVSVGIANPTATFEVFSDNATGAFMVRNETAPLLFVNGSSGFVGIGTRSPDVGTDIFTVEGPSRFTQVGGTQDGALIIYPSTTTAVAGTSALTLVNNDTTANNWVRLGFADGTTASPNVAAAIYTFFVNHGSDYGDLGFITRDASGLLERMRLTSDGKLGIGVSAPSDTLTVNGTVAVLNSSGGPLLVVKNSALGNESRVGIGVANPGNALSVNGTINASGTINQGGGLDIAEQFGTTEPMNAGDIVAIVDRDNVKKSTQADAGLTIGVVSTQPGFTMSKQGLTNPQFIALAGRVPVNVVGAVQKGDYITISSTPGVGAVATEPGFVVGRALENSAGGSVYIIINPGYFSPRVDFAGNLIGGTPTRKYEPPRNEKLTGVVGAAADITSAQEITTQKATISGELQTDIIRPEQGKDVVVVLG